MKPVWLRAHLNLCDLFIYIMNCGSVYTCIFVVGRITICDSIFIFFLYTVILFWRFSVQSNEFDVFENVWKNVEFDST